MQCCHYITLELSLAKCSSNRVKHGSWCKQGHLVFIQGEGLQEANSSFFSAQMTRVSLAGMNSVLLPDGGQLQENCCLYCHRLQRHHMQRGPCMCVNTHRRSYISLPLRVLGQENMVTIYFNNVNKSTLEDKVDPSGNT